jgi:hypothetical protein
MFAFVLKLQNFKYLHTFSKQCKLFAKQNIQLTFKNIRYFYVKKFNQNLP